MSLLVDQTKNYHPGERPDRFVNSQEPYFFRKSVIKMKLNTFLKVKSFKNHINEMVTKCNRVSFCCYHFLNISFLYLLENNLRLPEMNDNFFYQASVYSVKKDNEWYSMAETNPLYPAFQKYKEVIDQVVSFPIPDSSSCSLMISQNAVQIRTAVKNHLNLNFCRRFLNYFKSFHKISDSCKINYIIDRIFGKVSDPKHPCKFDNDQESLKFIEQYREQFNHPNLKTIITDNLNLFLPFYYTMLKHLEENKVKTFTILPLKGSFIPSHVSFNTTTFIELYRAIETKKILHKKEKLNHKKLYSSKKEKYQKQIDAMKQIRGCPPKEELDVGKIWNTYFSFNRGETANHWFDYSFTTNGYDVSIIYKIPKNDFPFSYLGWNRLSVLEQAQWMHERKVEREEKSEADKARREAEKAEREARGEKENKYVKEENRIISLDEDSEVYLTNWNEWDRFLGLDPGGRSLFTTVDQDNKTLQCSKEEYRTLTGFRKREILFNKLKDANQIDRRLQDYSFKTSDTKTYLERLKKVLSLYRGLEKEYARSFYRKWGFYIYQKKQEAFKKLKERLTEGKRTVIAFGNGSCGGPKIRGCNMPVKSFREYLRKCPDVLIIMVNEGFTTKMCFVCKGKDGKGINKTLKHYVEEKKEDGSKKEVLKTIYGLRRCNNNECRMTWNRDINASKNIYHLLECLMSKLERPMYLRKQTEKPLRRRRPIKYASSCKKKKLANDSSCRCLTSEALSVSQKGEVLQESKKDNDLGIGQRRKLTFKVRRLSLPIMEK